jgi:hypothetical protein
LNNVVELESGVTILFNIVDSYEQCGQQNIVQSCFHQYTAKTHRLLQVDIDRREQCCAANYEQVVNHAVPSCYS